MATVFGAASGVSSARKEVVDAALTGDPDETRIAAGKLDQARALLTAVQTALGAAAG